MANIKSGIYQAAANNLCTLPVDHPGIEQSLKLLERLCVERRQAQMMTASARSSELQRQQCRPTIDSMELRRIGEAIANSVQPLGDERYYFGEDEILIMATAAIATIRLHDETIK